MEAGRMIRRCHLINSPFDIEIKTWKVKMIFKPLFVIIVLYRFSRPSLNVNYHYGAQ